MTNSSSFSFLLWNIFLYFVFFCPSNWVGSKKTNQKTKMLNGLNGLPQVYSIISKIRLKGMTAAGGQVVHVAVSAVAVGEKNKTIHNSISLSVIELVSECLLFGWSDRHKKSPPLSFCTLSRGKWNISVEESLSLSKRNEMMRKVENPEEWLWPQPWRWNCFFFKYIMNQRWVCCGGILLLLLLFSISCRRTKIFLAPVGVDWNQETKAYFV